MENFCSQLKKDARVPVEISSEKVSTFIQFRTTEPLPQMQKCMGLNIYRVIKNSQRRDNNSERKLSPCLQGGNKFQSTTGWRANTLLQQFLSF